MGLQLVGAFLCLRRGVSIGQAIRERQMELFSAYAEVFPAQGLSLQVESAFLCLRRGVSISAAKKWQGSIFSLPTQRCFPGTDRSVEPPLLFSAYAEVFPAAIKKRQAALPFLCLRRGVSE